jgi:hypothetical protein
MFFVKIAYNYLIPMKSVAHSTEIFHKISSLSMMELLTFGGINYYLWYIEEIKK